MFGSRRSSTDSFVMAMGRKAGNIKRASPAPAGAGKKGAGSAAPAKGHAKTAPAKAGTGKADNAHKKVAAPKPQMHSGNGMSGALSFTSKQGYGPNENKPWPKGKSNTFKTTGTIK